MQIAYFFLKPDTTANTTTQGNIPTSVDLIAQHKVWARLSKSNEIRSFKPEACEAFETGNYYWASSQYGAGSNNAYIHRFAEGYYAAQGKTLQLSKSHAPSSCNNPRRNIARIPGSA